MAFFDADVGVLRVEVEGPRRRGQVADPARRLSHALTSGRCSPGEHLNRLPSKPSILVFYHPQVLRYNYDIYQGPYFAACTSSLLSTAFKNRDGHIDFLAPDYDRKQLR